jgi:NhaA family Na+:H+ antiporter
LLRDKDSAVIGVGLVAGEASTQLLRAVDRERDHVRGGNAPAGVITLVVYSDYLCPYCRRLRTVIARLRKTLGERLAYVFRHSPNERIHPGAEFMSAAAEAAGLQGRFWEMHDFLYDHERPLTPQMVTGYARELGLDMDAFQRDIDSDETKARIQEDIMDGRHNGVTGTPAFFIDGQRYDGAWDYHSMLEALEQPVATRIQRRARIFANLPASGGLVLILAAVLALICANTPMMPYYHAFVTAPVGIGVTGNIFALTVANWFSEGLLAIFFLLVGLEIRREMTSGGLTDPRAALLPVLAAIGGVLAPAAIYLLLNPGPTAAGWAVPTATDIAFVLGILALLGDRVPASLRIFIAALAVVDDILSVLTLAIFYPRDFHVDWLIVSVVAIAALYALNRARVYTTWPYIVVSVLLWFALHSGGVHGALTGIFLAAFLPTRPAPRASFLLAQVATALSTLESAETEAQKAGGGEVKSIQDEPVWDWASRNLSAASDRLISPAERIERAVAPWSTYAILPLFSFSATGIALSFDFSSPNSLGVLTGSVLGLVIGKPLGIVLASYGAMGLGIARGPKGVSLRDFIGAACLCGIGDTVALLIADQAFPVGSDSAVAKIGVLAGSILAAALGAAIIASGPHLREMTPANAGATR